MAHRAERADTGLLIGDVDPQSTMAQAGLSAGDRLLAIDGLVPRDLIDLQLDAAGARRILVERAGRRLTLPLPAGADAAGVALADPVPGGIRECNNHCEFCFIRGLPRGLRSTLYVFDDDYRLSFLWGSFLTLTNLDEADWARIGYQRLSPLNVSVHATDPDVRRRLLNNRRAPAIVPQLARLGRLGIQVNAQVVLCAGINDGAVLDRTMRDLAELYPAVRSVSVVPVGLTRFSRVRTVRRPTPDEAAAALEAIEGLQATLRARFGAGVVYGSDELYLLAGWALPPARAYDGYPVLANGVGLLRSMLDEWERLLARRRRRPPPKRVVWLAGRLAAPALRAMARRWEEHAGWRPEVREVANHFFGEEIGVSGLLSGADIVASLRALPAEVEEIVVPAGAFGFDGGSTLDGLSAEEVGAAHRGRVYLAGSPRALLEILADRPGRGGRQVPAGG